MQPVDDLRRHTESLHAAEIRSCAQSQDLISGKKLHARLLLTNIINSSRYLDNLLVEMYGKCRSPDDAARVFDHIETPNVFSWNLLLAAYSQNGNLDLAYKLFQEMPSPDTVSWNTIISAFAASGNVTQAKNLFDRLPQKNTVSWNALASAYSEGGYLRQAKRLFDITPRRNTASWNIILTGYARAGHTDEAEKIFQTMPLKNVVSWTAVIAMHAGNGNLQKADELFEKMPDRNVVSWTTMVQAYAQAGHIARAREIFDRMPQRSVVSWNVMLLGYAQGGRLDEARSFFARMPNPNTVSRNAMMQAYIANEKLEEARRLFDEMADRDIVSWTSMVSAYARCGDVDQAEKHFQQMPVKNSVAWNTMIAAYAENGHLVKSRELFDKMPHKEVSSWTAIVAAYRRNSEHKEALHLFKLMDLDGGRPDVVSFTTALGICSALQSLELGKLVHSDFLSSNLEPDVALGNSLIDLYSSCGCLYEAGAEFDQMHQHNADSWTCLIRAYTLNARSDVAVAVFRRMDLEGWHPDNFAFAAVYEACGRLASLSLARDLHAAFETSDNRPDLVLENALIDLYAKCANLTLAESVFDQMRLRDLVTWSSIIAAYVQNGDPQRALELFCRMIVEGLTPDQVNFVTVLTACSHLGDAGKGFQYSVSVSYDYHLQPVAEHYHCMVDLLARAGKVKEAEELVANMPFVPGEVAFMSLLSSHRTHGSSRKTAAETCVVNPAESASYVMMSNICATPNT